MIGNFFHALAWLLNMVINALLLVIIVNVIMSWVQPHRSHPLLQLVEKVSDAVCNPVRRLFPTAFGGFDFAPLIVMIALEFIQRWLVPTLEGLG